MIRQLDTPAPAPIHWSDTVEFLGRRWSRALVHQSGWPELVSLDVARDRAKQLGGRLPRLDEWQAAARFGPAGNCAGRLGGLTRVGTFPCAWSGLFDLWGNAWEWVDEGLVVGGSFAAPVKPAPQANADIVGFRVVFSRDP